MFSCFSCFSCISSTKAVISLDISKIEQTIPIIEKDIPVLDVSHVPVVPNKNILDYLKILKEPEPESNSRLEDSKSEFIPADSDSDEEEICVILANNPPEYSQPRIITPIQDESREPIRTPVPMIDVQ